MLLCRCRVINHLTRSLLQKSVISVLQDHNLWNPLTMRERISPKIPIHLSPIFIVARHERHTRTCKKYCCCWLKDWIFWQGRTGCPAGTEDTTQQRRSSHHNHLGCQSHHHRYHRYRCDSIWTSIASSCDHPVGCPRVDHHRNVSRHAWFGDDVRQRTPRVDPFGHPPISRNSLARTPSSLVLAVSSQRSLRRVALLEPLHSLPYILLWWKRVPGRLELHVT